MELTQRLDGTVEIDGYESDQPFAETLNSITLLAMETLTIRRETPTAWEVWTFGGPGAGLTPELIGPPQTVQPKTPPPTTPASPPPLEIEEDFDLVDAGETETFIPGDIGMVRYDGPPTGKLPEGVSPSQADPYGETLETETRANRHATIKVNRGPNKKAIRVFAAVGVLLVGFVVYAATRPEPVPEATQTICLDSRTNFEADMKLCDDRVDYYVQVVVPQDTPRPANKPVTDIRSTVTPAP